MGDSLGENLRRLRERKKLTYVALSELLDEVGRPIPVLGLRRIERGERRVDADDLVALAVALNVSPAALLLPPANGQSPVKLTSALEVTAETAWKWVEGKQAAVDRLEQRQDYEQRQMSYLTLTHPWVDGPSGMYPAVRLSRDLADAVDDLATAGPDADPSELAATIRLARRRYAQLGLELEAF